MPAVKDWLKAPDETVKFDFAAVILATEVADPKSLPFIVVDDDAEAIIKGAATIFKKAVVGGYREAFAAWAERHGIENCLLTHIIYILMLMIFSDVELAIRELTIDNFKAAAGMMHADMTAAEARSAELHGLHDYGAPKAWSLVIYERFRGIAEFAHHHHLIDGELFWMEHPPLQVLS